MIRPEEVPADRPVLIAGPTASGKSGLALAIAEAGGGVVVNADALQVFDGWRLLTARPSPEDEARAPHRLYGHVPRDAAYSVGDWLREVAPLLGGQERPIIVGGTGLYFAALTEGLAEIPPTPPGLRAEADALPLPVLRDGLDPATAAGLDLANRARVQRAWEVLHATGRGMAAWQAETPPPLLPLEAATPLVLRPERDWLAERIARRFDSMLEAGLVEEARAMEPAWDSAHQSARAIGAAEMIAHVRGELSLRQARDAAIVASRQYAKRQRTWMRKRMADWRPIPLPQPD
ncbi:tRNA delta(2)-isopentenylpyrophosphate transferase [Oceanicola granulosus HTCC2516]|uniref:tRNA dimethylallyltransferase n=1 Tax=Oceanicola granulosus (strain ATCC BAA-861 / DSM 15982 / KCTC 12143 / HTCC2516) TaxID=314256 RepID=Q2CE68_OCEGH|nr:tRNA (adenosine(37)-N6)-dimethylallyltransferase MiaA [Oceanicola granulosus]EAR50992.1 tRNA delta(2)-isopentenylpyrophosphate transferase [Oceanicola granulosus HTCC2516]